MCRVKKLTTSYLVVFGDVVCGSVALQTSTMWNDFRMAFGKNKDDETGATGRYVVHTVTPKTTGRTAIQDALNEGDSRGWSLFAFEHNAKNGQFVLIWEKPS